MPFYEITTSWNIPSGIPTKTYMYFNTENTLNQVRNLLGVFWSAVDGSLSNQIFWSVDPTGKILNEQSGALLGEWSDSPAVAGQGGGTQQPVADATQINLVWNTGAVVNGRFLRGRSYIPGLATGALSNGNLTEANRAAITTAGQALADSVAGLCVWHRPKNGFGGSTLGVTSAVCRSELAVLRHRRNRG